MTKQEVIKEAYGEYWEQAKEFVDENGWFNRGKLKYKDCLFLFGKDSLLFEKYAQDYFRPKSLQGIENNNNWIKIESFNDFPKEEDVIEYWVLDDGEIINAKFMHESKNWYHGDNLNLRLFPTHYQPIEKPKPPIY